MVIDYSSVDGVLREENFSFSHNTTYGCGGNAKIAFFPKTEDEAIKVFDFVRQNFERYVILGNGSNVLASDNFFDGAVISTKYLSGLNYDGNVLRCLGGTNVSALLSFCIKEGLSGLEYLAGIPASVGGLAIMNGGINTYHIGDNISCVEYFDGAIHKINNVDCDFGLKHSTMSDINCVITAVELHVKQCSDKFVRQNVNMYLQARRLQPKGKSCGCVFKNPVGFSAGKLIDQAGLKGLKFGCAEVSKEHANFIINHGNTSSDVYALINIVKKKIFEACGINLEEEVVYIGEFNGFNF